MVGTSPLTAHEAGRSQDDVAVLQLQRVPADQRGLNHERGARALQVRARVGSLMCCMKTFVTSAMSSEVSSPKKLHAMKKKTSLRRARG